ncbi:PREDICTED: uncharacterized protein C11orf85 homolog [Chrysochloris asiatica]|uniref:Uncharacterized protein C11orf85 homolog n=1 Tax=Chrysochloris asiatica TaxID=185453 RepID=A0A9B0TGX6_CHRAS|nr:PREDICTED: uncharacterized protein C11orf85 homolog [Chrysochloris asiatica]
MSLKPFTFPFPETRFLHAGLNVYKFKIRYGSSIRLEEIENKDVMVQQLEESIRVVLGNLDNLQPFATEHFIIFPYKSQWESVSRLKFKRGEMVLIPYPFVFTLYVEMKWFHENPSPGEPVNSTPLGLVADEKKSAGALSRKRRYMEVSSTPRTSGLDREKAGMSKQCPSKKKITKNKERKHQQEWQEAPAVDNTDVQEQGSQWEDSVAGQVAPLTQQSNPSLPKEPTEPGATGFFGFLSSLFPFNYFFRKDSQ